MLNLLNLLNLFCQKGFFPEWRGGFEELHCNVLGPEALRRRDRRIKWGLGCCFLVVDVHFSGWHSDHHQLGCYWQQVASSQNLLEGDRELGTWAIDPFWLRRETLIGESVREPDAGLPTAFAGGHSVQQIMEAPWNAQETDENTRAMVDEEASPTVEGKAAFEATNPKHGQQRWTCLYWSLCWS